MANSQGAGMLSGAQEVRRAPSPAPGPATLGDRRLPAVRNQSAGPRQTIDNPLLTFDDTVSLPSTGRTELEDYVFDFTQKNNLEHRYELLIFGARLARDKHEAMIMYDAELTAPEKQLLENEKEKSSGFWQQSKFFRATIITASLAGVIQGWTQSANNGTISGMPEEFDLCINQNKECISGENTSDIWTFGMLNAIPLLSAGLFGTTLADPLQENYLGRRGSVMISCIITVISTIGASAAHNVAQLAICRAINGIALGAKASIAPIYSAELSPEHIRGAILANWQLADAAGIFLGFLANLIVVICVHSDSRRWRILTNTVLIPTIPLLIMIYLMPESPRYLMKHGEYEKALEAFTTIQTTPLLASRDFMYAHAQLDFESRLLRGKANERGNLAERIHGSQNSVLSRDQRELHPNGSISQISISPAQSIRRAGAGQNLSTGDVPPPRDSHQQSTTPDGSSQQRNIELSNLGRRESDLSSLDMELGMRQLQIKDNPYSYHIGVTGFFKRVIQLWENKRCRRALISASIAMISQQLTGVNTIAFLGTNIWDNSLGINTDRSIGAIIGIAFGASNYLFGLPAYYLSDKIGRSILLAAGLPNTAWSMLVFAFLFKLPESPARIPLIGVFAVIFVAFYGPTAGTSPFSISAEVFPLVSREAGMAVSVAINLLGAGMLVLIFPFVSNKIGPTGSLSIFAGLNLVAFVLVYLFVPETRRRTLEELQYTFDLSTKWHVEYRAVYIRKHFLNNFWKYLTGKQVRPPVPFYRWARIHHGEGADEP